MRLPPQHSRGDDDIERAKPTDDAAHRWVQDERPNAGIVAQEVVSIPQARVLARRQADPRYEQKDNPHFK